MTTALKLRRGTTSQHSSFTGAVGEVTVDTTKKTAVVHDGATAGGTPLATEAALTSGLAGKQASSAALTAIAATGVSMLKNRIINGAMVIDQRNAGASVTNPAGSVYSLDRWKIYGSQASKFTVQQSSTAPAGFSHSLLVTSSSSYSSTSTDEFEVYQLIEGFNTYDLAWGTASAKAITLSFQVYSSLTGTFGGVLRNSAGNYSYPFTYTVTSANTWTSVSISVAGPTAGTWVGATNGVGLTVLLSMGAGSTNLGTAGSWSANGYAGATGQTNLVGTSGATLRITGVQLEVGASATAFEYRQYGQELALCQRYYQFASMNFYLYCPAGGAISSPVTYQVTARAVPTIAYKSGSGLNIATDVGPESITTTGFRYTVYPTSAGSTGYINGTVSVSSEL